MTDIGIKLSDADRLRLAKLRRNAVFSHLGSFTKPHPKPDSDVFTYKLNNKKQILGPSTSIFQKKKTVVSQQPLKLIIEKVQPQEPVKPQNSEIELTREQCFCAVMDILFEGMGQADKVSKEAAKQLMLVMENEVGSSVSLLVYNSYVRMYNSLRQEYFLSTAANIKAKTIKISADIIQSLEQMAKTIKIEMPPSVIMPSNRYSS